MSKPKNIAVMKLIDHVPRRIEMPSPNPRGTSKRAQREHHRQSLEFLEAILLVCPETGGRQLITNVLGARGHYTIFTKGKKTAWMHQVKSIEI